MKRRTSNGLDYVEVDNIIKVRGTRNAAFCPVCARLMYSIFDDYGRQDPDMYRCFICGTFKDKRRYQAEIDNGEI
jgi:hypothetical protein